MAAAPPIRVEDLLQDHLEQDRADFASLRKWVGKLDRRTAWIIGLIVGVNGLPIWILTVLQLLKLLGER